MSGGSEDGEGMKPVDSGEGDKRDIDDADAAALDGFTILDAAPDAAPDNDPAADDAGTQDGDAEADAGDDAGTVDDTEADSTEGESSTAEHSNDDRADKDGDDTEVAATNDNGSSERGGDDVDATSEADTAPDGADTGELSFDEWLAAAEIPTDDPKATDQNNGDTDKKDAAAASGRGRKKNRRSRRSRKKSANSEKAVAAASSSSDGAGTGTGDAATEASEVADGEDAGTPMSEIMAELLAAAEQSSLERSDEDDAELDTEVELDPEATSEFAAAGERESEEPVSAAIAAVKANAPGDSSKTEHKTDKAATSKAPADDTTDDKKDTADSTDSQTKDSDADTGDSDTGDSDSEDSDAGEKDAKEPDKKTKDSDSKVSDKKTADSDGKDSDNKDADSKVSDDKAADNKDSDGRDSDSKDSDATDSKGTDAKAKDAKDDPATASVKSPVESKTSTPTVAPLRRPEQSSNTPIVVISIVAAVVGLYAILVVGWVLDSVAHRGEAMRGVQLADISVGGSNEEGLGEVLDTLDANLEASELTVSVDDVDVATDPFNLGVRHDREPMVEEALAARRGGFIAFRPIRWLFHLFTSENVPAQYTIDDALAAEGAEDIIIPELDAPVEPQIELTGSRMALVPGSNGVAVDPDEIVDLLPGIVDGAAPYEMALTPESAAPQWTDDAVETVVDEINEQTEQPILAQVLDQEAEVSPRTLKTWMVLDEDDGEPTWSIDEDMALEDLKPLFPALGSEDQQARFSVVDGEPIIIPASETVICCEEGTLVSLGAAIKRNIPDPIEPPEGSPEDEEPIQPLRRARLEPAITGQDEGVAELESLGIIEEISTFTTPHDCCQNRVINIQRFADLMQGVVIRPGESFSLNEFVGQRTREKGFVADGAIVLGNFEPQVGGGISQYATTFFNASFFAGIEFLEYQSHSIYISRYPRGREATISWRRPDLEVLNNTDYGILVWNEYTDTSITVTFYSTKNREVEALPLLRSSDRQCRIDITPRVITFEDGTTQEDSVRAIYRPGQGLDCNGNSTTPEEDEPEQANNVAPEPAPAPDPGGDDGEVLPPGG